MEPGLRPTPPAAPPSTATILFGKYQLGRLLGRGGFAKVYQAVSLVDNSTVAVKIIDKSRTVGPGFERCVTREIAAMHRLDHPNILKIHEVLATKSKIYLIVEFAAGGELLGKIIRRRRFTESIARRYFQQLVLALKFCHENGVVHRDVKPQNLLLDEQGHLKISDFGLSALTEPIKDGSLLKTACGTPAYSAPEVMYRRGGGGYDGAKADAWSCGVILFVMLSGFNPFDDSNLAEMFRKIHRRDFKIPNCVSKPARFLIHHLLDPDPKTRMGIEGLIQNPWFKKSLKPEQGNSNLLQSIRDYGSGKEKGIGEMNAFDIISMSSGLDLSGLFETAAERRFTASATAREVEEKVREIGGELGYELAAVGKGGAVGMGKGRVVVVVEVAEVAPATVTMLEVRVVKGGEEFEELHWRCLEAKFEGFAVPWQRKLNCVQVNHNQSSFL